MNQSNAVVLAERPLVPPAKTGIREVTERSILTRSAFPGQDTLGRGSVNVLFHVWLGMMKCPSQKINDGLLEEIKFLGAKCSRETLYIVTKPY